jgi:fatty acid desaturase
MFLKLRIFFTILSALCAAVALTAGALWGFIWTIALGMGAVLFFMLMLYFKRAQEQQEEKEREAQKFFTYDPNNPSPNSESDTNESAGNERDIDE